MSRVQWPPLRRRAAPPESCAPKFFGWGARFEIAIRKYFGNVRFTGVLCVAQHFDSIGAALSDEDVSIRRGEQKSRIAKPAGVQVDLKSRRHTKLRVRWTTDDAGHVYCQNI